MNNNPVINLYNTYCISCVHNQNEKCFIFGFNIHEAKNNVATCKYMTKKDAIETKEKFEEIHKDKYYILKIQDEYKLEYEEVADD